MTTTAPLGSTIDSTQAPVATAQSKTLGIVSLVLGITAIVSGFTVVLGIAAIVVGIISLQTERASRGFATAGIVTGSVSLIGIVIGVAGFFLALPFIGLAGVDWIF